MRLVSVFFRLTPNIVRHHRMRCALRYIRPRLTLDAAKSVTVISIVGVRLDYCNNLLYGTSQRNLDRLQRIQSSLARVVTQAPHRTPVPLNFGDSCTGCQFTTRQVQTRHHHVRGYPHRCPGLCAWRLKSSVINRRQRCALMLLPSCIGLTPPWTFTDIPSQSRLRLSETTSLLLFVILSA